MHRLAECDFTSTKQLCWGSNEVVYIVCSLSIRAVIRKNWIVSVQMLMKKGCQKKNLLLTSRSQNGLMCSIRTFSFSLGCEDVWGLFSLSRLCSLRSTKDALCCYKNLALSTQCKTHNRHASKLSRVTSRDNLDFSSHFNLVYINSVANKTLCCQNKITLF